MPHVRGRSVSAYRRMLIGPASSWKHLTEWDLRFLLVRLAKRELWSRRSMVMARRHVFWRERRRRAAALYEERFGAVPPAYACPRLPKDEGAAFHWPSQE